MEDELSGKSTDSHARQRMGLRSMYEGDSPYGDDRSVRHSADVTNRVESESPRVAGVDEPGRFWPAISLESGRSLDRSCPVDSWTCGAVAQDIGFIPDIKNPPPPPTDSSGK